MRKQIITAVVAGAIGLSSMTLTGPALAAAGATDAAAATTARVDRIEQALTGLVTDGTLTQAQADKVATTLDSADIGRGRGHGPGHGHGPGRGGGRGGAGLAAAATALKMTPADVRTALAGGQTLAQVAQGKGVAVDTLVAAIVAAEKTRIAQQVTDGRLTQAQADERVAGLTARVTERVNSTRKGRGHHDNKTPSSTASPSPSASPTS